MVLAAVPDDSYLMRIDLGELPGRQVRALGSPARLLVAWVTSQDVLGAGWQWARLSPGRRGHRAAASPDMRAALRARPALR